MKVHGQITVPLIVVMSLIIAFILFVCKIVY